MQQLPEALAPLAAYHQFIIWRAAPHPTTPGKTTKLPIDWRSLTVANAHNPEIWLDAATAIAIATQLGPPYGTGFVFTANDPFFFVDVDGCLLPDGSGWSGLALQVLGLLPGAAVEVSQSGNGLHIIGTGHINDHGCKNVPLNLEFYTRDRFVALTGDRAGGNAATDLSQWLPYLVATYFPPGTSPQSAEWTDKPVAEWHGPEDDAALIAKATASMSGAAAFSGRAAFKDLWNANADALARTYPDTFGGGRAYDASSADAALAQHLAFYTGNNCERMLRLMLQSALKRDKWERTDYLYRTITRACAQQSTWYSSKRYDTSTTAAAPPAPTDAEQHAALNTPGAKVGSQFMAVSQQIEHFQGCVYVRSSHRALIPGGELLKPEQFKVAFGGFTFALDTMNEKTTRSAWEAFTESQAVKFPRADRICFRPDRPAAEIVEEEGLTLVNKWWPIETPRQRADVQRFTQHVEKMLPQSVDRSILYAYMAALVQYPGFKFQWCPVLQGVEGNGKTVIISCIAEAVGHRYTHLPNAKEIGDGGTKFNAWIEGKLFIGMEEIYVGDRREVMDALKPLITNSRIEIQYKGMDQVTGDNRANFIMCTNHKDAVIKSRNDRRYAIMYCAQQSKEDLDRDGMSGRYFPELYEWLRNGGYAAVNDFLRTYQIPDELNPARGCQRAPTTSSTAEAIAISVGPVEQEIIEAIEQGKPGFANGWVSSIMLDALLVKIGAAKRIAPSKRRDLMSSLGYEIHPGLKDGRVNAPVAPDNGRPRLYVKKGHLVANMTDAKQIADRYAKDQSQQLSTIPFGVVAAS